MQPYRVEDDGKRYETGQEDLDGEMEGADNDDDEVASVEDDETDDSQASVSMDKDTTAIAPGVVHARP
jgi:hypothetical protein